MEPFYEIRGSSYSKVFDKRGLYLIVTFNKIFLWIGSKIYENVKK